MKICACCRTEKPCSEFGIRCRSKDGLQVYCNQCRAEYRKVYTEKIREKIVSDGEFYDKHVGRSKVCSCCKLEKGLLDFHKDSSKSIGFSNTCKSCATERARLWHHTYKAKPPRIPMTRDEKLTYRKEWYKTNSNTVRVRSRNRYYENREEILRKERDRREDPTVREKKSKQRRDADNSSSFSEILLSKIPKEDEPLMTAEGIEVKCKNCGKRIIPTRRMISKRIESTERLGIGESNFYCSQACANSCPLYFYHSFNFMEDKKKDLGRVKPRWCKTEILKQQQCEEYGHNYCEKCGDIIDVELHHTLPVSEFGLDSINPASHMLLCAGCHVKHCK